MGEHPERLLDHVAGGGILRFDDAQEAAWVEVIRKMDEVYSDLIRYEVDLEKKNAALEEAQGFISSVVESVSDVLIVCDERGVVQQVNPAMTKITGLAPRALIDRPLGDLIVDGDSGKLSEILAGRPGMEIRDCEVQFKSAQGVTDIFAMNCSARLDHNGRQVGAVLTGRPVGELRRAYEALNAAHKELKQAQRQLVQQEKMASLGRLVAGVAHELNNPISFIYGNIHILDQYSRRLAEYLEAVHGGAGDAETSRLRRTLRIDKVLSDLSSLVEGTQEGAERVSDIVKNLRRLSFSSTAEPQTVEIEKIIKTAVRWAARSGRRKVGVAVDLAPGLSVRGHEGQIHQVIVNLVENAFDATQAVDVPSIVVEGRRDGDDVVISIRDNGPGLADDIITKIFDPFFTTKAVGEGTGLGLWISYGIARDHGGVLEAANGQNGGAVFVLRLPAANG